MKRTFYKIFLIVYIVFSVNLCFANTIKWEFFNENFEGIWVEIGPCTRSHPCYSCLNSYLEFLPGGKFRFWVTRSHHCVGGKNFAKKNTDENSSYQEGTYKIISRNIFSGKKILELSADWDIPSKGGFIKKEY